MTALLWFVAASAAWTAIRSAIARRDERNFVRDHPLNSDGIMIGAEPIHLEGTRRGAVLLLHGYNDSPQSMHYIAAALHARGWTVRVPLLPGHGRRLQDWAAARADAWESAARAELAALRTNHDDVAVGGLSMGGALAFILAAEHPEVRAVVGFAPYLHASLPVEMLHFIAPVASLGAVYVKGGGSRSVHDQVEANAMVAYRMSTPRVVVELEKVVRLARQALPKVRQPVLVVQSREDNRIPAASAAASFEMIGSADKTMHWTTGNGHVVTVDYGHAEIERLVCDWLEPQLP
ncbi:MAG TPA: alpha/beta fold hydrolase [Gemmatimonadaceae bacterium]|jgi:carboxylesterase|nr:alpha/beta fold hydrolase [Gemmatimonadaceae bacterium]